MMLKSVSKLRLLVDETRAAYLRGDVNYIIELDGIAERIEQEVSERFIELPLDADGVPIRVGDKMETESNCIRVVDVVQVSSRKWSIGLVVNTLDNAFSWHDADRLRHYHKPTVEDVLREFGDWYAHTKGGCDEPGIIAEYAAKLRLAGDEHDR